jgi:hypothetical protein
MLGPSVDCFKDSGDTHLRPDKYRSRGPYSMTNYGLQFPVPLYISGGGTKFGDVEYLMIDMRNRRKEKTQLLLHC